MAREIPEKMLAAQVIEVLTPQLTPPPVDSGSSIDKEIVQITLQDPQSTNSR
jgi:hypothetical protein